MLAVMKALQKVLPEYTWTFVSKKECEEEQTFDPPCKFLRGSAADKPHVLVCEDGEMYLGDSFDPEDVDVTGTPTEMAKFVASHLSK